MRKKRKTNVIRKDTSARRKPTKPRKERVVSKRVKAPLVRNDNTMTEQEFFNRIAFVLRNGFRYWRPMYKALKEASRPSQSKNKLLKHEYQCCKCKRWFPRTEVQIDHIKPVGQLRSYEDLVGWLENLTQEDSTSYQILCKPDHKAKTKLENDARRAERKLALLNTKTQ